MLERTVPPVWKINIHQKHAMHACVHCSAFGMIFCAGISKEINMAIYQYGVWKTLILNHWKIPTQGPRD